MSGNAPGVDNLRDAGFVLGLLCEFLGDYGEDKSGFHETELVAVRRIAGCCRAVTKSDAAGDAAGLLAGFLAWRQGPEATTAAAVASLVAVLETLRTKWNADPAQQREFADAMFALWRGDGRMTKAENAMVPLVFGMLAIPPEVVSAASSALRS